ncbi:TIGR02301 family protein [Nostoc sp. 3335mG]|nr:TIGR02301 family protein [Nostoc sp. 3335mG]
MGRSGHAAGAEDDIAARRGDQRVFQGSGAKLVRGAMHPSLPSIRAIRLTRPQRRAGWWAAIARAILAALMAVVLATPSLAVDPPYQRQMERLAEVMGSLYYLQPLCKAGSEDWRAQMAELIALDEPDEDRRQRLAGAFNTGYQGYSRLHRQCTPASREALSRLLLEAQQLVRAIHTRFAE